MDVRKMDFPANSFDVAIDKVRSLSTTWRHLLISLQGTLDAMLHGSLWDPEDDVKENAGAYVDEVCTDEGTSDAANST